MLQKHIAQSKRIATGICKMKIGYARISTSQQDTLIQHNALEECGCEIIFTEQASGGRWDRPELHRLLDQLRKGDTVVVWKLDRLSRSLKDLLTILEKVEKCEASFLSLTESIDTSSAAGRMMMQMVGAFAEFERAMLRERTLKGLESARKQGRVGGRKPKLTKEQQSQIMTMLNSNEKTAADMARLFKVHPATISRLIAKNRKS